MAPILHWLRRPHRISSITLLIALLLSTFDNYPFFQAVFAAVNKTSSIGLDFKIALYLCLTALFCILLSFFGFKYLFKPFTMLIVFLAAGISYFMSTYGVIIDSDMIQNAAETDSKEVLELLNFGMFWHIGLLGVLPAVLIYLCPIAYQPLGKELLQRGSVILLAGVVLGGLVFVYYKDFSLTLRNNHSLRYLINPNYPVYSLFKYLKRSSTPPAQLIPIGTDAKQASVNATNGKKTLLILVVGETARASSFSLNGYSRDTNPELSQLDIINFSQTYSCGTATAASVPCMFSHLDKAQYSDKEAKQHENLLDVLQRAGIKVFWRDNNSGCKGVCDRVATEKMENLQIPSVCSSEECFDPVLLEGLSQMLQQQTQDTLIVLHQKGSHGPAYYKRHPANFTRFSPECQSEQVQDCSQEEIKNAYDNTIAYTDHFLAQTIKLLQQQAGQFNTALWYMSDHGESLGENGIYLHGLPYFMAPDEQIHIPFVLWISPELAQNLPLSTACLQQQNTQRFSHDNLFHSVLGLFNIQTQWYKPEADIFKSCR